MTKTKFYTYRQNNTGGNFIGSDIEGISKYVIIEAIDKHNANERAEQIGLYFDGCSDEIDCPCCGDRWYRTSECEATDAPSIYGELVENSNSEYDGFIHYLDGTFKKI